MEIIQHMVKKETDKSFDEFRLTVIGLQYFSIT